MRWMDRYLQENNEMSYEELEASLNDELNSMELAF